MNINDGKGLYDNEGLIDTLIVDCNNLVKHLASGQYVQFCNSIVGMVQKLANLKEGIKTDKEAADQRVAELEQCNNKLVEQLTGLPAGDGQDAS